MTLPCRCATAGGAALAAALWVAAGGAAAQVPTIPAPPDTSTTVPATPPAPDESPSPSVPDASRPPEPPGTTTPGAPGSPKPTAGGPTTTSTTVAKASSASSDAVPPAKQANLAPPELSLDLSQLGDLRRQARGKGPRPAQPDSGFDEELPFSPGAVRSSEEGDADEELGAEAEQVARVRSLGAVAGGLESLVVLGTVVWLLRRANPKRAAPPPLRRRVGR